MVYEYNMVQIPPAISVSGAEHGTEAATYLQTLANDQAHQGWDFFRIDVIGVELRPGCLGGVLSMITGGLLGGEITYTNYYVVTFRREATGN